MATRPFTVVESRPIPVAFSSCGTKPPTRPSERRGANAQPLGAGDDCLCGDSLSIFNFSSQKTKCPFKCRESRRESPETLRDEVVSLRIAPCAMDHAISRTPEVEDVATPAGLKLTHCDGLSLPLPFQAMNSVVPSEASAGESSLVSGEIILLPKVTPLSAETMTLRLSLPSPFQAR